MSPSIISFTSPTSLDIKLNAKRRNIFLDCSHFLRSVASENKDYKRISESNNSKKTKLTFFSRVHICSIFEFTVDLHSAIFFLIKLLKSLTELMPFRYGNKNRYPN